MRDLPDFVRAPNQADDPALYEVENAAIDPAGTLAAALWSAAPWAGRDVLDLGCGSGYWLPTYTDRARSVLGVEPDRSLLPLAAARAASVPVRHGSAEHIPLPDAAVDVVHARFAYFFPPGCDAGLAEVMRVLRPGGALVVIDNDQRRGEFAELLTRSPWAAPQGRARCWPRSARSVSTSTDRSSIAGVWYSTGMEDSGGRRSPTRKSGPDRTE